MRNNILRFTGTPKMSLMIIIDINLTALFLNLERCQNFLTIISRDLNSLNLNIYAREETLGSQNISKHVSIIRKNERFTG